MKSSKIPNSPVYPSDHKWPFAKRKNAYESDITAMVRGMLEDDAIREDQSIAWERWRNDNTALKSK